jgi:CARDB
MTSKRWRMAVLAAAGCATWLTATTSGCGDDANTSTTTASTGAGASGGMGGAGGGLTVGAGGGTSDCSVPCPMAETCSHGVCIPITDCTSDNECQYDTYCEPGVGCLPWDDKDPSHDPNCVQVTAAGVLQPAIQCAFEVAPASDAFPGHVDVQGTPIVVHLEPDPGMPDQPATGPSVIAASFTATVASDYTEELGVIRVLRGDDCTLQANLGGIDLDTPPDGNPDFTVSSASLAAADLDGDSIAEIVAYGADGSTIAFHYKNSAWEPLPLWKAAYPVGAPWGPCNVANHRCSLGWAGASIHDLDDDGVAEVIREGVVFSNTGQLLSMQPPNYASYGQGLFPVIANLDQDPEIEMANGERIWAWQNGAWVEESYFPGGSPASPGLVAVADFGDYGTNLPSSNAEIAVVRGGSVLVYAATGEIIQGPITVPGGGSGGPPTIGDFDGDGLPELGVAAQGAFTVYDIDCGANPRPNGVCPPGQCDFNGGACPADIAWSRQTQDDSSSVTGSSIFDFEADGISEVVYADECFVRVYDGNTGDVIFSQYRSSCTWHENPIIADVDGDFRAELVTPSNKACSDGGAGVTCDDLNGDGVDIQYNGARCDDAGDCGSGVCDAGLCRCTATAECCGAADDTLCTAEGYLCVAPEPGTPGTGNTCRAAHPAGVSGIRVYSDVNDQWVNSRRIWNQHAYAVTHISESGVVPSSSQWLNNWEQPTLNNFRQNVPGSANGNATSDTTAGAALGVACNGTSATLTIEICNRGALPVGTGIPVGFYVGGTKICEATTSVVLFPEDCESVACVWDDPPADQSMAVDVTVIADDGNSVNECKEGNNQGGIFDVFCKPAG